MPTKTPVLSTPAADEIDEMLGGTETDLDAALETLTNETQETVEDIDLQALNLTDVVEMDYRPLADGQWYDAIIASAKPGRSAAGNLQITFVIQVDSETDRNGITVLDYAGIDPKSPKGHWKIKKIAKRVGLLSENDVMLTKNPKDFVGRRLRFQNRVDTDYDASRPQNKAGDYDYPTAPNLAFVPAG